MNDAEKLARLTYALLRVLIVAAVGSLGWLIATGAILSVPKPDPQTGTTGLKVETDAGTGCQYVTTPWGGIFVRLGPDGKPLCTRPAP